MIPLPPPVAGDPFDVETAAGRVTAYRLGEGRTVLILHRFNAAGSGIELAPLASRLAEHRRVVLVDWLGFGTSARPDAPYGWALYGAQLECIREAAMQPGEASVDVVALSLPGQYVVVAAAEHPERFGRALAKDDRGLLVENLQVGVEASGVMGRPDKFPPDPILCHQPRDSRVIHLAEQRRVQTDAAARVRKRRRRERRRRGCTAE